MRVLGFSKRWPKLKKPEFTTFRFPRKDSDRGRDWQAGEKVKIVYKPRSKYKESLGVATILIKTPTYVGLINDEMAVEDGFSCRDEMIEWLSNAHNRELKADTLINRLTLRWAGEGQ